jgi:integrase
MKLTAKRVEKAKPGRHYDGDGLVLQVSSERRRSWLFRYERNGKERWAGLGSTRTFSLKEARERARKMRQMLADGIDPIDAKRAAKAKVAAAKAREMSFKQATEQYMAEHEAVWSAKHASQWRNTLRDHAYPVLGALPVEMIDTPLVLKVLKPIWGTTTETASRLRQRIEAVLGWATVNGYRQGDNPARWENHIENALPAKAKVAKVAPHAAMDWRDVPAFMAKLAGREGVSPKALAFTILTAARTSETIGATWNEIKFEERMWVVPAERMKAGKEHRVPLSDAAVAILRDLPSESGNEHVFVGWQRGAGLSDTAMSKMLNTRMQVTETVHGFRSAFRDWAAETTNFQNHVVEMALAHAIPSGVEKAYRRGDLLEKRRKLMEAWARYCMSPPASSTVVPMKWATA